jgi:DNA-binding response OmpR family regulator
MNMPERKILIIDDDSDIRLGLNVRLRASGYSTAFAVDGVSAIRMARNERPSLILLDLGLPAGDGFQVLEWLKINTDLSHVPVIVLSARDAEANERRALKAGAWAYLEKPVDDEDLLEAIGAALK